MVFRPERWVPNDIPSAVEDTMPKREDIVSFGSGDSQHVDPVSAMIVLQLTSGGYDTDTQVCAGN